jgi:protein O-mannosyl-transferase
VPRSTLFWLGGVVDLSVALLLQSRAGPLYLGRDFRFLRPLTAIVNWGGSHLIPTGDPLAMPARSSTLTGFWQRRKLPLLAALLFVATLLLYAPALSHRFVNLDDNHYVSDNLRVTGGLTAENVYWAFHTFTMGHWHPLTWLSHMLDCQLFGINPAGHHASSVLLHAFNALLLFLLLARATGAPVRSFLVAALFAAHPLNVESVAWVAERKTVLCTLFSFLTLAAYGWYARTQSLLRYLLVLIGFLLALMAKSMAVTLPVAMLLIDYWPLQRLGPIAPASDPSGTRPTLWGLVLEKLPLLLISLIFSYLAVLAQHSTGTLIVTLPLQRRLQNAAVAYVAYIGKALWPARLSVFYPYSNSAPSWTMLGLALLLLTALTVLSLRLRRQPYLAAGWIFFLVTLLPVIGIIQVGGQAMADRYAYTPLIGLFVIAVWGLDALRERLRLSAAPLCLAALCAVAALGVATRVTLSYWQDSLTLFTHAERVVEKPDELIEVNLGLAYDSLNQPEEALRHYEIADTINPHSYLAHYNIGRYLLQHNRAGESIPESQQAIQDSGSPQITAFALGNLGEAYLVLGDYAHAEPAFAEALRIDPGSIPSLLGRGQALLRMQRFPEAEDQFAQALSLNPQPELYYLQGMALEGEQKNNLALDAYHRALHQDPGMTLAQTRIAALENQSKRTAEAPR